MLTIISDSISYVTEPLVTQTIELKVEEEKPVQAPPATIERKKTSSRLKNKKKKKKFNISSPPLKTPRRMQEKKEEKVEPPPQQRKITKLPSVTKRDTRSFQRPITANARPPSSQENQPNWFGMINVHQKSTRPTVQTHVFDFNADDFFGRTDNSYKNNFSYSKPLTSTSHQRYPHEKSYYISGNPSFTSPKKISSQTSTVRIRRMQNVHDFH